MCCSTNFMFNLEHFRSLPTGFKLPCKNWVGARSPPFPTTYVASSAIPFELAIALSVLTRALKASIGTSALEVIPLRFQPKPRPTTSVASVRECVANRLVARTRIHQLGLTRLPTCDRPANFASVIVQARTTTTTNKACKGSRELRPS